MDKKQYLYKIYPPRADFYLDQNEAEKNIMDNHKEYWQRLTDAKCSIVYGPVFEPKGTFPMAVIEVHTSDEAENIAMQDPAVLSGTFTYTLFPMQVGMIRAEYDPPALRKRIGIRKNI